MVLSNLEQVSHLIAFPNTRQYKPRILGMQEQNSEMPDEAKIIYSEITSKPFPKYLKHLF